MKLAEYFEAEGRGSASRLADAIGAYTSDVSDWAKGSRPIPVVMCVAIERVTGGSVTRQELRPDDYWLVWPDLPAPTESMTHQGA
jgi:DNA-binding transcriptional regulator YdaS (Cro superfamily)